MDSFNERNAEEYVDRFGVDLAVERLSLVAKRSGQAKRILDYILDKYVKSVSKSSSKPVESGANVSLNTIRARPGITKRVFEPKEKFLNMMNVLNLSFDLPTDDSFHPLVYVKWKNGRAYINNFRVNFPSEDADFMYRHVLSKPSAVVRMTVLSVNRGGVFAKPDVDEFFRRARKQAGSGVKKFRGNVLIGKRSIYIRSDLQKRIVVPKHFMSELLVNHGQWMFKVLDERKDSVLAEPVEKVDMHVVEIARKQKEYIAMKEIKDTPLNRLAEDRLDKLVSTGNVKL